MKNYALQFGKTIPKKYFDIPEHFAERAPIDCSSLPRFTNHDFQEGEMCRECCACHYAMRRRCSGCAESQGRHRHRFVQFAVVEEQGNGLLTAQFRKPATYWCGGCVKIMMDHPRTRVTKLNVSYKALEALCQMNRKDFPPYWAEGRKIFRKNVVYLGRRRDTVHGMDSNNLWNPILDIPQIEKVPHHVIRQARLEDPFEEGAAGPEGFFEEAEEEEEEEEDALEAADVLGHFFNLLDGHSVNYFRVLWRFRRRLLIRN